MHLPSLHLAPVFWFGQQKLVLVKVRKINFLSQNIGITLIKVRERQYDLIQFNKKIMSLFLWLHDTITHAIMGHMNIAFDNITPHMHMKYWAMLVFCHSIFHFLFSLSMSGTSFNQTLCLYNTLIASQLLGFGCKSNSIMSVNLPEALLSVLWDQDFHQIFFPLMKSNRVSQYPSSQCFVQYLHWEPLLQQLKQPPTPTPPLYFLCIE